MVKLELVLKLKLELQVKQYLYWGLFNLQTVCISDSLFVPLLSTSTT